MKDSGKVNIHGKEYKTVALRVQEFRSDANFDGWSILTHIDTAASTDSVVVMHASILDTDRNIRATGHAEEIRGSTQINKTSALENCETSAIGRALACLGLGGSEFASADEVANAIGQQKNYDSKPVSGSKTMISDSQMKKIYAMANQIPELSPAGEFVSPWVRQWRGVGLSEFSAQQASNLIKFLTEVLEIKMPLDAWPEKPQLALGRAREAANTR